MIAPPALRLTDLTLGYDRFPAVHHLSGIFRPGTLTAVVGPNGAGKSTLLKALAGALPPLSGSIDRGGLKRPDIAYLPQIAEIDRDFPIPVGDFVSAGLWRRTGAFGALGRGERAQRDAALATVRLTELAGRPIGTLSGGQMQRALFARLILQDCGVVLLDEPFASLDAVTLRDLMDLLHVWHCEGRTVIAVVHDLDLVRRDFPETLLLAREVIGWGATGEVLNAASLADAQNLVQRFDRHAPICHRDAA